MVSLGQFDVERLSRRAEENDDTGPGYYAESGGYEVAPGTGPQLPGGAGLDPGIGPGVAPGAGGRDAVVPFDAGDLDDYGDEYYQAGGAGLDEFDLPNGDRMDFDASSDIPPEYLEPEPWHEKYRTELYLGGGAAVLLALVLLATRKGSE